MTKLCVSQEENILFINISYATANSLYGAVYFFALLCICNGNNIDKCMTSPPVALLSRKETFKSTLKKSFDV